MQVNAALLAQSADAVRVSLTASAAGAALPQSVREEYVLLHNDILAFFQEHPERFPAAYVLKALLETHMPQARASAEGLAQQLVARLKQGTSAVLQGALVNNQLPECEGQLLNAYVLQMTRQFVQAHPPAPPLMPVPLPGLGTHGEVGALQALATRACALAAWSGVYVSPAIGPAAGVVTLGDENSGSMVGFLAADMDEEEPTGEPVGLCMKRGAGDTQLLPPSHCLLVPVQQAAVLCVGRCGTPISATDVEWLDCEFEREHAATEYRWCCFACANVPAGTPEDALNAAGVKYVCPLCSIQKCVTSRFPQKH